MTSHAVVCVMQTTAHSPPAEKGAIAFAHRVAAYCHAHPFHPNGSADMPPGEVTYMVR